MFLFRRALFILILIFTVIFSPGSTYAATSFDLLAPTGSLTRGQEIQFTVNIDTQSGTVSSVQIGATYQTQYLQYLSTTPGEAMSQLTAQDLGGGKILFTGSNPSGFKGKGVFAYINFKIIAQAQGETELCTLWAPSATPTTPATAATVAPTAAAQTPLPTRLPASGNAVESFNGGILGILFIVVAGISFFVSKSTIRPKSKHRVHHKTKN